MTEADEEIRGIRAEVRALEAELMMKDVTINELEKQLRDVKEALSASMNDSAQRHYMIQAMLACPPHALDTMHKALLPELPPNPRPTSAALCMAGARSRSRSPRASQ